MLIMDLLIPMTMIIFGGMWVKRPPKKINGIYGYRTAMSMINKDTWVFAHNYAGRLWYKWGLMLLPITLVSMFCFIRKNNDVVGTVGGVVCFVQMLPLVGVIIPTQKALNKSFDKNGNRR